MTAHLTPLDMADEATLHELDALRIRAELGGKTLDEITDAWIAEERASIARSFDRRTSGADNDNLPEEVI